MIVLFNSIRLFIFYIIFVYLFHIRNVMEKRSEKREAIVTAAKTLFWKHGIRRVTIEEICETAGVSKMTCYKYFENKTAIARYLLEDMFESGTKAYKEIYKSDCSYEEKVKKLLDLKISNTHEMSQELLDDIYKNQDEELFETIETIKKKMIGIYLDDLRISQKNGEIRDDIKPEFLLYFLTNLTKMLIDPQLVSIYPNPEQMIVEVLSFFFYGIMPRKIKKI
jgi:AcrR family transcriptional regulator